MILPTPRIVLAFARVPWHLVVTGEKRHSSGTVGWVRVTVASKYETG